MDASSSYSSYTSDDGWSGSDSGYTGDTSSWTSGWGVGPDGSYSPWSQDQANFANVGWEGSGGTGSSSWMANNGYTTGGWDDSSSYQYSDPTKYAGDTGSVTGSSDFSDRFRRFLTSFLANKVTKGHPLTGPALGALQAPEGERQQAFGRGLGSMAVNGLVGAIPGLGMINTLSGLFGGPTAGSMFNGIAKQGDPTQANPDSQRSSSNMLENVLTAGMGLYGYNKATQGLDKTISGLQGMYGPNSAYSQQLQKSLERRDAAAGRRSQYGPRNVELQAKLAEMNSRNAPQLAQMYGQRNALRDRGMNTLMQFGKQTGIFDKIGSGLSDMWDQAKFSNYPEINSEWVYG